MARADLAHAGLLEANLGGAYLFEADLRGAEVDEETRREGMLIDDELRRLPRAWRPR